LKQLFKHMDTHMHTDSYQVGKVIIFIILSSLRNFENRNTSIKTGFDDDFFLLKYFTLTHYVDHLIEKLKINQLVYNVNNMMS